MGSLFSRLQDERRRRETNQPRAVRYSLVTPVAFHLPYARLALRQDALKEKKKTEQCDAVSLSSVVVDALIFGHDGVQNARAADLNQPRERRISGGIDSI